MSVMGIPLLYSINSYGNNTDLSICATIVNLFPRTQVQCYRMFLIEVKDQTNLKIDIMGGEGGNFCHN